MSSATISIVDDPRLMPWDEWDGLVEAVPNGTLFLHSIWLRPWCATFLDRQEPFVVLVRDGERLLGGFPFVRARVKGLRVLRVMGGGAPAPDHLDVVALPDYEQVVRAMISGALRSLGVIDIVELDGLTIGSSLVSVGVTTGRVTTTECPVVELPESWDDYMRGRSAKFRGNFRRTSRALNDGRTVRVGMASADGEIGAAVRWLAQQRVARSGAEFVDSFADDRMARFHSAVAQDLARAGHLRLHQLFVDERLIACAYCFQWRDQVLFYNSAIDDEWSKFSPGTMVLGEAIKSAIDEGARVFDMFRGDEAYKRFWSTSIVEDVRVVAPISRRGRVALAAKRRPRARDHGAAET